MYNRTINDLCFVFSPGRPADYNRIFGRYRQEEVRFPHMHPLCNTKESRGSFIITSVKVHSLLDVAPILEVAKFTSRQKFPISLCKLLKNKCYYVKVPPNRFHLNGHTTGYHSQTRKLEQPDKTPSALSSAEAPAGYPYSSNRKNRKSAGDDGKRGKAGNLFSLSPSHGSPRALFFFLSSLPTTQRLKRLLRRRELHQSQSEGAIK